MKKIKIAFGITWAFICLVLIIILFPGLTGFSRAMATLPFMKINPRYTGGEEAFRKQVSACTLVVRKPVFAGLWKERKTGFVQIDWRGNIPENIVDTIDFDLDSIQDFAVSINTRESSALIYPFNKKVEGIDVSTPTSYGWALRVKLKRQE